MNDCAGEDSSNLIDRPMIGTVRGVARLTESRDSNIWSLVPRDFEPRKTVLARTSSNLLDPPMIGSGRPKY
jgi:hypothetical protein